MSSPPYAAERPWFGDLKSSAVASTAEAKVDVDVVDSRNRAPRVLHRKASSRRHILRRSSVNGCDEVSLPSRTQASCLDEPFSTAPRTTPRCDSVFDRSVKLPPSEVVQRHRSSLGLRRSASRVSLLSFPIAAKHPVSDEDARWFQTLPEKIQRQQFDPDERAMFTSRNSRTASSPAPEMSADLLHQPGRRFLGLRSHGPVPRTPMTIASTEPPKLPETDVGKGDDFNSQDSLSSFQFPLVRSETPIYKEFVRRDSTAEAATSHPPPATSLASPARKERALPSKAQTLTPIKLPPPRLRPTISPSLPSPSTFYRAASTPRLTSPASPWESESPRSGSLRDYHDVRARHQLREVLETPEKFDDAVRFGFAAPTARQPTRLQSAPSVQSSSRPCVSSDCSVVDGECDDRSADEGLGPATPTSMPDEATFAVRNTSSTYLDAASDTASSVDPAGDRTKIPFFRPGSSSSSIFRRAESAPVGREMTMRMTLTRPELRDPDFTFPATLIPGRSPRSAMHFDSIDPLALQPLEVLSDDPTGAHGAFSADAAEAQAPAKKAIVGQGGRQLGLRKVWKSMKKLS